MKRDYYKSGADRYDSKWEHYTNITLNKVLQYLPASLTGKKVLDWGCGTGELIKRLLLKHPDIGFITGYDPVEEMLEQAQKKMQQLAAPLREKVALQTKQPFNSKFDLIVSSSVLHYLPQPERSLDQFKSLLQDGGKLVLLDYTRDGFLVKYFEWAIKLIDSRHQQAYSGRQIREMVERQGFAAEREEAFNISLLWKGYVISASAKDEIVQHDRKK